MAVTGPTSEFATLTTDDLVTGEGVALDLPPASLPLRMTAGFIDLTATIILAIAVALVLIIATIPFGDEALTLAALVLAQIIVFAVFPTLLETLTRGRSLGKLALGLRAVRADAGPISFHHALVRALIGFVEIYLTSGFLAFFAMLLTQRTQRLGDLAAGTYVIRDRVGLRLPHPPPMPPEVAGWARRADLTALPTGLSLAIRQYLGRLPGLDPQARLRVGETLLEEAMAYVAPAPPAGVGPESVLAAMIAERRERDLARLRRDDEFRRRLTAS